MRTANPALNTSTFRNVSAGSGGTMTLQGTVNKSFFLVALVIMSAALTWTQVFPSGWSQGVQPSFSAWHLPAVIGSLILAFIIIFKKHLAPYLAPVYAILEGVLMGAISALFEYRYPGIVFQAVLGTAAVFASLLVVYKSGLIKVTDNFRLGVAAATGGIFLIYMIGFVMSFFGAQIPLIHSGGPVGILFSLAVIAIAALNLVLDFDFIENASEQNLPKYMEWYAAFGLLITLVWLYIEILRLLAKMRD